MNMTRMYMYIWPTSAGLHAKFLFLVSSEAKGTFNTPKSDQRLVV